MIHSGNYVCFLERSLPKLNRFKQCTVIWRYAKIQTNSFIEFCPRNFRSSMNCSIWNFHCNKSKTSFPEDFALESLCHLFVFFLKLHISQYKDLLILIWAITHSSRSVSTAYCSVQLNLLNDIRYRYIWPQ